MRMRIELHHTSGDTARPELPDDKLMDDELQRTIEP